MQQRDFERLIREAWATELRRLADALAPRRKPGRPPKPITLGELALLGQRRPKRRPGRKPHARAMGDREFVEAIERAKRELGVQTDKAVIVSFVEDLARTLGGRDQRWKDRKIRQWQMQVSRARKITGIPQRRTPKAVGNWLNYYWR